MRKRMWLAAAAVVLLSGAGALAADNNTVTMKDLYFEPADITVVVNTPVVFHNGSGSSPHDAKAVDNSFSTNMLDPGKEQTITLTKVGEVKYFCTVPGHKSAGMEGTIVVTAAGGSTASTTTATTQAGTATTTTAPGQTTTTTSKASAGGGSTTTTAAAAGGATSTTLAPAVTPTSAPDATGESTTTTAAGQGGGEEAAADHGGEGGAHPKKAEKNSPIGIAFAAVSTLLLVAIAGKLLASKS